MLIRNSLVFALSALAPFLLQPQSPIRNLDFWLPLASLGLILGVWLSLHGLSALRQRRDQVALLGLAGAVLGVASTRYLNGLSLTPSRPPDITLVLAGLIAVAGVAALAGRVLATRASALWVIVGALIAILAVLKSDALASAASALLRPLSGQPAEQARATDLGWLGYSYLAFRLIAVLRDRMTSARTLRPYGLGEFVTYALFAPTLLSGPIDRADRFLKEWRAPWSPSLTEMGEGARRILIGLVKKLAIADTLALIALNADNAAQLRPGGWVWVMLYAYAFRIYFDFGGYSDIAIGLGRMLGVKLPENFDRPYLKSNLTQFWNSWHMSLSQWFRGYWFNPLTRALRVREWSQAAIVGVGQVSTMLLIGLWHGLTLNFVAWGAWHAAGLFIHNRFADWAKTRPPAGLFSERWAKARQVGGILLTFHFVLLGWVCFALPTPALALRVLGLLAGVGR
jgi:D-alanyl-lipoteichoic acid acyltransferase DltB (MBOAT superfamily)